MTRVVLGKPEMVAAPVISRARPRHTYFVPIVEINGWGRRSFVRRMPLSAPKAVDTSTQITSRRMPVAPFIGRSSYRTKMPAVQIPIAKRAPAERSMPPSSITCSMPKAIRATVGICRKIFAMFADVRNFPPVASWSAAQRMMKAARGPTRFTAPRMFLTELNADCRFFMPTYLPRMLS